MAHTDYQGTRITPPAHNVPTVVVRHYSPDLQAELELDHPFAVVILRDSTPGNAIVHCSRHECGAEAVAAEIRGALADAYLAGHHACSAEYRKMAAASDH